MTLSEAEFKQMLKDLRTLSAEQRLEVLDQLILLEVSIMTFPSDLWGKAREQADVAYLKYKEQLDINHDSD